ncbi:toprim domain-containing protein, partial [Clostridium chrysemydis]
MKKVIIAEKPSVAKNIADAFKIKTRRDGYFEGEEYLVTWAFGHLLQLYDAKDYDESMRSWRMEKFPFIPEDFKYKVKTDSHNRNVTDKGALKQINIIKGLIDRNDVDGIISATDFDREGQVISDEL